jgi:hypothetical protein
MNKLLVPTMNALTTRPLRVPAIALLTCVGLVGCDGSQPSTNSSASATAAGTAKPSGATASATAQAPKVLELELVEYKPLGVSMQLPKGRAVVQDSGEMGSMWTYSSLQVSLEAAPKPVERDEDLHSFRVSEGLQFDKKTDENGLLLAIGSRPKEPKPVVVRAAVKGTKATVQCVAEEGERKLAIDVCSSIRKLGG